MVEWFHDESFWIDLYPVMFTEERLEEGLDMVDKALSLVDFRQGSVLDLCCGPGRHSVHLARKGFSVTGVDGCPFLIEKAKARGKAEGVEVEWRLDDMRTFLRPESFDLVINLFTSFGYFDRPEDDLEVLRNTHRNLRPGGALVLDIMSKEPMARAFKETHLEKFPGGVTLVQHHEVVDDWSRLKNEWILIRDGKARSFEFTLNLYSGRELRDRMLDAGFNEVSLYGDLDGAAYDLEAKRLVIVARKDR